MTAAAIRTELLAPAGEPRALRAALAAGADAVYFGLERFSARAFAGNFAGEAAVEAVELAHRWNARAYLALNTLLKDDEVELALAALEAPYAAGVDALIVADLGFAALVREQYPGLALHASTQLNTHSSAQLQALSRLGFARAVLARELSLDEISALRRHGLELEAFVHGALCYGYSGDCLLASMVGGRSGNRGRCSQACRMRYALRRAGAGQGGGSIASTRVLSTSDLAAIGVLPQLITAGVSALKIEGRMKDPEYVGITTAVYREALDAALADPSAFEVRPEWLERLEQNFSRSFTTAHLQGRHHEVRSGGRSGHRGVPVGRVSSVDETSGEVRVRLSRPLAAGDLVYLYTPWGQSEPVRVEHGAAESATLHVRERVAVKDRLFRLAAADTGQLARDLIAGRTVVRPAPLRMMLSGDIGERLRLTVDPQPSAGAGAPVSVVSTNPLAPARTVALDETRVRDALGALGGTPYALAELKVDLPQAAFLAVSELKDLRRRVVAELDRRRVATRRRAGGRLLTRSGSAHRDVWSPRGRLLAGPAVGAAKTGAGSGAVGSAVLLVLRAHEDTELPGGVTGLCLDVRATDRADLVVAAGKRLRSHGSPVRFRLPEVVFDADEAWLREVLAPGWDGVYVRHLGVLDAVARAGLPFVLEYPLQGLNALTAEVAAGLAGRPPAAILASPEASLEELAGTAARLRDLDPPAAVEVLAFGRQQVLHTRDQLGRAEGLCDAPDPAGHVDLLLEDAKGYVFPAEVEATGTRIGNARVANLAGNLDELRAAGVTAFLVVQADMTSDELAAFRRGGLPALAAFVGRERSTTGHLFRGVG
jgi:putative protease